MKLSRAETWFNSPFISTVSGFVYLVTTSHWLLIIKCQYHLDVNEQLNVSQSFPGIVSHRNLGVVHYAFHNNVLQGRANRKTIHSTRHRGET